jgi:hypothetical protein
MTKRKNVSKPGNKKPDRCGPGDGKILLKALSGHSVSVVEGIPIIIGLC